MTSNGDIELYDPEPWEKPFLEALVNKYGVVGKAAREAGIHPKAIKQRLKESPTFALMYEEAVRLIDEVMEYEAVRRAIEPHKKPIYQRGQVVGYVEEWDTKHLEWMLERRLPEKYHIPTRIEFAGGDADGAVTFRLEPGDKKLDELEAGEEDVET